MPMLSRVARRIALASGLCTVFLVAPLHSQTKPVTVEELTQKAEVVAVGQVRDLVSEWDETGTRIRTRVLLFVDQFVKGSGTGNTLTLYVPGGEVGSVGEIYSHMPVFKREEHVIVFASQDKLHHYRVTAGEEGKFSVEKNQRTGVSFVPGHATLDVFTSRVKATVLKQQTSPMPNR